jgi:hypothetical protein
VTSTRRPQEKPLTLVAYEAALVTRAYVKPLAVGDVLQDMPVFLKPSAQVPVPLEATYQAAFEAMPRRWRSFSNEGDIDALQGIKVEVWRAMGGSTCLAAQRADIAVIVSDDGPDVAIPVWPRSDVASLADRIWELASRNGLGP